jgi:dynein heavy chain
MNDEIEKSYNRLYDKQVPELWKKHAYSSIKPLASWFTDLLDRIKFIKKWIDTATTPYAFWISGLFFIPGFLTGVL